MRTVGNLRVHLPREVVAHGLESIIALLAHGGSDHAVVDTMAHEDGGVLVGVLVGDELLELLGVKQPGGEADDAGELVFAGEAGEDGKSTALGEATDQDALRWDASINLSLDEALEVLLGLLDTLIILVVLQRGSGAIENLL